MKVTLKNFLIPTRTKQRPKVFEPSASAVVPTYKPGATALRLVEDLLRYKPRLAVVVVDDSTPQDHEPSMRGPAHEYFIILSTCIKRDNGAVTRIIIFACMYD